MYISVDFDDTIVVDAHHIILREVPGALETLRELINKGHVLILETMRSGHDLHEAIEWLNSKGIIFNYINKNPIQKQWTTSPKIYANIYIDNLNVGCPLIYNKSVYPYVDWIKVRKILVNGGYL